MKKFAQAATLLLSLLTSAVAQMTPQYESYTTWIADAIRGKIKQTVVLDGTTIGSCTFTYVCGPNGQQCTGQYSWCPTATHTPKINNVIKGVGGWSTGSTYSPFSYITYSTTVEAPITPGEQPPTTVNTQVICSVIGAIAVSQSGGNVPLCMPPATEATAFVGWHAWEQTSGMFRQTLSNLSGTNFDGHYVFETTTKPGTNSCFWPNSGMPQFPTVEGSHWTVGSGSTGVGHNQWGNDTVGWDWRAVENIRDNGPAHGVSLPCLLTIYQTMQYECDATIRWVYKENVLTHEVRVDDSKVCRAGNCEINPW